MTDLLRKTLFLLLFAACSVAPANSQTAKYIVILHTNDTHSQIEPTDNTSGEPNRGGYVRRMALIDEIRQKEPNVLLFDAGDFWQGTPFFNLYHGRVEIDGMNRMRYDAVTLGNHEFDNGMDTAAVVLREATFPIVDADYDFGNTPLKNIVKPYIVLERFGLKIGVFGLTVSPFGLIFEDNFNGVVFKDPIKTGVEISKMLKKREKCDIVVCLSHLGSVDDSRYANDFALARASEYIDVIIGGHSHTLLDNNTTAENRHGRPVVISQMGKSGLYLGRIDLILNKK